jgi:uroporphyrinogen-III decarboxylase
MLLTSKANLLRAIVHADPDHVPWAGEGALRLVDHAGRKPPRAGVDAWGVAWAPLPASYQAGVGEPAESYPIAPAASSVAELLERSFPAVVPAMFAGLLEGLNGAETLVVGQHGAGLLDRFVQLLGMPAALTALLSEPEASGAVIARVADHHVQVAQGYLAAGAEAGWLADDYAGDAGPLLSPRVWRRLFLPELARIIAVYRQAGAAVFFHTCGRAEAFIPDLLDAGVAVFNLQSDVCDLAQLKARHGRRIAFFGGVATELMQRGPDDRIAAAACTAMWVLGREGGLILAPDQPLAYPPEHVAVLDEAARRAGRYPFSALHYLPVCTNTGATRTPVAASV